ncbi:MAG: hypothetical protein CMN32_14265 [Saprospirales bacterium]|nr:hypothetical protein [Saprospirales bacterium]
MDLRWNIAQALEIRWWNWYLKGKEPGNYLKWKRQYWFDFFQRFGIPVSPSGQLLEVGCGPAGAFLILPKENLTVLDPLLPVYRRKHPEITQAYFDELNTIEVPIEQWSSPAMFDHIFCFNVINHTARLDLSIEKLAGAMRQGARLYLSVDCHRYRLLKWLFRAIPGDVLHPQQLGADEYVAKFRNAGLSLVESGLIRREPIFDYQLFIFEK